MRGRIDYFFATLALLATPPVVGCSSTATKSNAGGGATAGSSPATHSVSTSPSSSASASRPAPTSAASASGKLDGVPKACPAANEVMSKLQLSSLVVDGGDPSICTYDFNGDKAKPYAVVTFNSAPGITEAAFESSLRAKQSNVTPVPGVADAAFSFSGSSGGVGLSFLSGNTVCSIFTTVPNTTPNEVSLAKVLLGNA